MKKYTRVPPFTEKEMRAVYDLIQGGNDRLVAAEAWIGGVAQDAYNRLASLDPRELKNADQIWLAFYRLGLAKRSDNDEKIAMECMARLDIKRFN